MNTVTVSKVHFNSSTGVSLNDRFTVMSKVIPADKNYATITRTNPHMANGILRRKRSNSVDSLNTKGSLANRQLLRQLDRLHTGHNSAFRQKNRNIRSGRQRLNRSNFATRVNLRRAAGNTLSLVGGSYHLQRSNSLSDIATMNADYVERQALYRTSSQQHVSSRLGNNSRARSRSRNARQPLHRTNSSANMGGRSRSRGGRDRSNSGSRSRPRMSRSRSRVQSVRDRSRSTGMNGYNGGNYGNRGGSGYGRARGRSNGRRGRGNGYLMRTGSRSNLRYGSVNGRLGTNRTNGYRGGRGWIGNRGLRRGGATPYQNDWNGGRPGRNPQRGGGAGGFSGGVGGIPYRGRSRSRGRPASLNRSRSGQRGRNTSQGRRLSAFSKSKEDLDKELDQYMASTKSSLDKEMDEYMNGMHRSI
ncbi:chromatin target of PRMT1 protein [Topomyia yanbarensis]|uniref:chromatin target of PRMT1 protein n=1 Tax=Topomyia yanbarensis TaxID=2498891 RepID=UPI00273BC184|nr:chromatin target of PRMT1 protein [Topomyia yanbarensis]